MITQHELKQRIDYDPDTGEIHERFYTSFIDAAQIPSIRMDNNYIRIDGVSYTINKIIWLYMTGEVAKGRIYTVNGIKSDKRWKNITRRYAQSHEHPGHYPPVPRVPIIHTPAEELTQDTLKEYISYDPETGVISLLWKSNEMFNIEISRGIKGTTPMYIKIQYIEYSARQLAYMYMTGKFHPGKLYVIDGDNQNLKWDNITTTRKK